MCHSAAKKKRENESQAEWNAREGCRKPPWGRADASWGVSTGSRSQGTAFKASRSGFILFSAVSSSHCQPRSGVTLGRGRWGSLVPDIPALRGLRGEIHQHGLQSGKASWRWWHWRWILRSDWGFSRQRRGKCRHQKHRYSYGRPS